MRVPHQWVKLASLRSWGHGRFVEPLAHSRQVDVVPEPWPCVLTVTTEIDLSRPLVSGDAAQGPELECRRPSGRRPVRSGGAPGPPGAHRPPSKAMRVCVTFCRRSRPRGRSRPTTTSLSRAVGRTRISFFHLQIETARKRQKTFGPVWWELSSKPSVASRVGWGTPDEEDRTGSSSVPSPRLRATKESENQSTRLSRGLMYSSQRAWPHCLCGPGFQKTALFREVRRGGERLLCSPQK